MLEHPETPLHNNPAELDERVAARRRDVSLHVPVHSEELIFPYRRVLVQIMGHGRA